MYRKCKTCCTLHIDEKEMMDVIIAAKNPWCFAAWYHG
jgi:hypothetical protein